MPGQHILLVEGQDDREFFQHLLCRLEFDIQVEPETPRNFCQTASDGVDVLRTRALPLALNRIRSGDIACLGIVIDADSQTLGYGFEKRRTQYLEPLAREGYNTENPATNTDTLGEIFSHPDNLAPIGLWIMPDHRQDGALEDLLLHSITTAQQQALLNQADADLTLLKQHDLRLFKDKHLSKARLSTLLSWQEKPGISAGKAYRAGIFPVTTHELTSFHNWLTKLFTATQA
ncbi:MAG TPA: hypothetical protein PLB10_05805 [Thiolinea sp.]|nr:hypothetical protein [Thiolinea sp.]